MPRKGENIYKRKDGRWEGRYIRSYDSEHKAKYAYVYGKTYSEVKRKLTEQRGNVQKVQPTKNKSSTYGELLDCWLHSIGFNNSTSTGYSSGSSWASAVTRGTSETKGETVTETDTDTTGDSRTITVTSENKSVKYILEKIDQHLARIKNCEAFGLWDIHY